MADPESLYRLDPASFTAARDALAKEIRAGGDRREADRVKKLRRPSRPAWALNQVARRHPDLVVAALAAGAVLRTAARQAIDGDATALRPARHDERRAVADAVAAAAEILAAAGHPASDSARLRMAETIRAAFVDDEVAAQLGQGVLDRERRSAGFALDGGSDPAGTATGPDARPPAERDAAPDSDPAPAPNAGPDAAPDPESGAELLGPDEVGRRRARRQAAALSAAADELANRVSQLREAAGRTAQEAGEARQAAQLAGHQATEARQAATRAARLAADAAQRAVDAEQRAVDAEQRSAAAQATVEAGQRDAAQARRRADTAMQATGAIEATGSTGSTGAGDL